MKSFGLTDDDVSNVTTVLVFVGNVHPDVIDSTQQRMNVEPVMLEEKGAFLVDDIMDDEPYPNELEDSDDSEDEGESYFLGEYL